MVSFKSLLSLAISLGAVAASSPGHFHGPGHPGGPGGHPGCGDINVFMTGLPAYHPLVIALGLDPAMVDRMLREDAARIVAKGYNLRVAVVGPEQDYTTILKEQMHGIKWHGAGVGYGLRSSRLQNLTIQLEDVIDLFHDKAPRAPVMFNYNAESFHWAVERRLPLLTNCTDSPGKDLGFLEFCDICEK